MTFHNIKYKIGDMVYLVTDPDQHQRMVLKITLWPGGSVSYCLSIGAEESWHFDIEFSAKRDVVKAVTS